MAWDGRSLRFRERRSQRCATSLDSARLNRVTNKNSYRSKGSLDVAINPQSRREESAGRYSRRRGHIGSAGSVICLQCSDALQCTSQKRNTLDENDHGQGWCEDFLQGLGKGPADRLLARLAALVRRLGQSDAVLRSAWIPGCCPCPPQSWSLRPDVGGQQYGPVRR